MEARFRTLRALGRGGLHVESLSYGVAALGNLYREVTAEVAHDAVDAAWEAGVRYFDVAPHYGLGLAERRLGEALASRPRDEFVISTKVGRLLVESDSHPGEMDDEGFAVPRTHVRVRDYSRDGVLRSIDESLRRTGFDRLDIVLVHDPDDYRREALDGAFPALDELRRQGVIRSYGAGMNQSAMLTDFVRETDLDVVMVAGRYTLLDRSAGDDLLPAAAERGVSVIAAGVFNSGILATDDIASDAMFDYAPAPAAVLAQARRLAERCRDHGVSLPVAAAQFPLTHDSVSTVCLGARSRSQVLRNAQLFETPVPAELWDDLADLGNGEHDE
jgi:D-threo-aldose 1-dehydrogenase